MDSTAKVRLASSADAEELSRLNQEFNGGVLRPAAKIIEHLNINRNELIAVAEMNGRIVGFGCGQCFSSFCYDEPYGEITELYIEEAARRQGMAVALISCLEENFRQRGVKSIKVLTGSSNIAAIRTYEQCSYVKEDEQMLVKHLTYID